jgi:hypothetical protein
VTWALDLGVVVPAVAATAVLLYRRAALGPLAATAMLALNVALGPALFGQNVAQLLADVPMTPGERVGGMASFAVMTVVAGVLLGRLVRRLPPGEAATNRAASAPGGRVKVPSRAGARASGFRPDDRWTPSCGRTPEA